MAKGWIVNVSRSDGTHEVERDQEPVLTLASGMLVFEVWFWQMDIRCWFVMTKGPIEDAMQTVFFHPDDPPEQLRDRVAHWTATAKIASEI